MNENVLAEDLLASLDALELPNEPSDTIPPEAPPDWDPKPDERAWYRSTQDGQRGYMVRRAGHDMIRLDRPMEEILKPYNDSLWQPDTAKRPLSIAQAAQCAYAFDQKLAFFTGQHGPVKSGWLDMTEEKRLAWIKNGPPGEERSFMFRQIMGAMQPWVK